MRRSPGRSTSTKCFPLSGVPGAVLAPPLRAQQGFTLPPGWLPAHLEFHGAHAATHKEGVALHERHER